MNGWLTALVVLGALLVSVFGGWPVAAGVLRLAARSPDAGRPEDPRDEKRERRDGGKSAGSGGPARKPVEGGDLGGAVPVERAVPADSAVRPPPPPADSRVRTDVEGVDEPPVRDDSVRSDGPVGPRAREALRGGTWIGILERVGVTGSLLAGDPSGVAVVVAIKGLGRFPELRENPAASERFVIGTLASLVWAGAVGLLGRALLLS